MTDFSDLPWPRINDFLLEVGSIRDNNEFGRTALARLGDLVPFDVNGVYVTLNAAGEIGVRSSIGGSARWTELYNNYYWKFQPETGMIVDWRDWRHTEYVAGFIDPQGIRHTAGIGLFCPEDGFMGGFGIHRSKTSSVFSERDQLILQVIQPHLANFHAINVLLAAHDIRRQPDADSLRCLYPPLTRREAEIAALICRRFRTSLIATQLRISPLTVYRHVANIFAKLNVFTWGELVEKIMSDCSGS